MGAIETRNEKLAERLIKNLESRHFTACYCATAAEAKEKILSMIPETDVVSYGGSETIDKLGIKEVLRSKGQKMLDRDLESDPVKRQEIMRQGLLSDTFLMSTNSITEDGELVNIDGNGNRVAALVYGPKSVIVAVSLNKVTKTLEDAWNRARNYAAPINSQRFNLPTPCCTTGTCGNCKSDKSICRQFVVTRLSIPGRIKVVLIGEELGF